MSRAVEGVRAGADHGQFDALVMAAQRHQANDPLAPFCGGGNKNFIDLHGKPMISWVVDALLRSPRIARVKISIEAAQLIDLSLFSSPERVCVVPAADNLYESVQSAFSVRDTFTPTLITTADNPLLTPEMVDHFCAEVDRRAIEAAIAMTRAEVMKSRYPDGQRRFYAFSEGEFSNCNLYAVCTPAAIEAASLFRNGGQFRKKVRRIIDAFGVLALLQYRLGRLSLESLAARLSRQSRVSFGFVEMPFPEAPIDVDNERSLRIAREILGARLAHGGDTAEPWMSETPADLREAVEASVV